MAAVLYADDLFIYADRTVGNPVITVIAASWSLPRRRERAKIGDQAGSLSRCLYKRLVTIHVSFLKNLQHQTEGRQQTNTTILLAILYEKPNTHYIIHDLLLHQWNAKQTRRSATQLYSIARLSVTSVDFVFSV
jgi:hypothetical protein